MGGRGGAGGLRRPGGAPADAGHREEGDAVLRRLQQAAGEEVSGAAGASNPGERGGLKIGRRGRGGLSRRARWRFFWEKKGLNSSAG